MRRVTPRAIGCVVLALLVLVLGWFFAERAFLGARVMRGVEVAGTSLGGVTRARAEPMLAEIEKRLLESPLPVRVNGQLLELHPAAVRYGVDRERTFERALSAGRDRGLGRDLLGWLGRLRQPTRLAAVGHLDTDLALGVLDGWEKKWVDVPFAGGVQVNGVTAVASPPRSGHVIDRTAALAALTAALGDDERTVVELPLVAREPYRASGAVEDAEKRARTLLSGPVTLKGTDVEITFSAADLARALRSAEPTSELPQVKLSLDPTLIEERLGDLRTKLAAPPRDARFVVDDKDQIEIVPSSPGTVLDARQVADALLRAGATPERTGTLPLREVEQPAVTTKDLEALGVRELVGKFTTHHACCQPRVDNIHHIADLLRGVVVKPGETFSVNAFIGPRTGKSGFKPAPTIEEGEMVDSLGGGISQFATTLFNALFLGGYDIVERVPHTYWFSRYPMGRDATLSWPKPDVAFKNDTAAGALIWTTYTDTSITVKIFGRGGGRKVKFKVSPQQSVVQPPVEYIPDITQTHERDKLKEPGQMGWTVYVTREIRFPDGTKKEEKRKVVYKPRTKRLVVHPCRVPPGEPGHTGEKCPEPDGGVEDGG